MAANDENATLEPTPFTRARAESRRRAPVLRPLPVVIGIVFLVLALAATFMFLASAVRVTVSPMPEYAAIAGGFTYRLGERYLALPGEYRVEARLDGYQPLDEIIRVTSDADQDFNFELEKLPGVLIITSTPEAGAEVTVDQEVVGTTPMTLKDIPAGLHDISFRSVRFLPFDTEVEIEGMGIEQTLSATLEPAWADITLSSLPDGADILVDNELLGTTPMTVQVIQGSRQIRLQRRGYKAWQSEIDVVPSEPRTLPTVRLIRSDGKLSVTSTPTGANVTIAGRYRGQTPLEIELAPGSSYEVQLSKAGFEPVARSIRVDPEQDLSLDINLSPVLGVIRLFVEPADALLFVDGKRRDNASTRLELTVRNHTIEVTKEGYAPYSTSVTPQPGRDQQLMISLKTVEQARVAAIADEIMAAGGVALKLILPGSLEMGAGRREPGRRSNEIEKSVVLTRPYYLGVNEITNQQFKQFSPNHESGMLGRTLLGDDDRPVVNVSWLDAARYCNWLSEKAGLSPTYAMKDGVLQPVVPLTNGFRLPTEAEWAWAARYARGSNPTRFPWGDAMPPTDVHANYADESAASMVPYHLVGYNDSYRGPAPVGTFPANEFGIHDLAGNVSEWIHDYYSIALSEGVLTDPTGPGAGEYHVVRGSNYTHGRFSELRWTFRDYGSDARGDVGFRVARYVE